MSTPETPRKRRATDKLPAGVRPDQLPFPWLFVGRKTALQLVQLILILQQQNIALQAENIQLQDELNKIRASQHGEGGGERA